jgi:hypothetical protein
MRNNTCTECMGRQYETFGPERSAYMHIQGEQRFPAFLGHIIDRLPEAVPCPAAKMGYIISNSGTIPQRQITYKGD